MDNKKINPVSGIQSSLPQQHMNNLKKEKKPAQKPNKRATNQAYEMFVPFDEVLGKEFDKDA